MCPRLGVEPVTLWFAGRCSTHWATPARAILFFWCTCKWNCFIVSSEFICILNCNWFLNINFALLLYWIYLPVILVFWWTLGLSNIYILCHLQVSFIFPIPIWMPFLFLMIAVAWTSTIMLNKSGLSCWFADIEPTLYSKKNPTDHGVWSF